MRGKPWKSWESYVPLAERVMRETPDPVTGISPFEYLHGFPPPPGQVNAPRPYYNIVEMHQKARKRIKELWRRRKQDRLINFLKHREKPIKAGTLVRRKFPQKIDATAPNKMGLRYKELWRVRSQVSNDEYECERIYPLPPLRRILSASHLSVA